MDKSQGLFEDLKLRRREGSSEESSANVHAGLTPELGPIGKAQPESPETL